MCGSIVFKSKQIDFIPLLYTHAETHSPHHYHKQSFISVTVRSAMSIVYLRFCVCDKSTQRVSAEDSCWGDGFHLWDTCDQNAEMRTFVSFLVLALRQEGTKEASGTRQPKLWTLSIDCLWAPTNTNYPLHTTRLFVCGLHFSFSLFLSFYLSSCFISFLIWFRFSTSTLPSLLASLSLFPLARVH